MTRRSLILPCLLAAAGALAIGLAACGDDDDDRLSDEEYFAEVDQLNRGLDEAFENEIFAAETAKAGIESFATAAGEIQEGLSNLTPPEDVQEAHDNYVEGVDGAVDFLEQAAEDTPEDASIDELEDILFGEGDPFVEVNEAECELAGIAEEKGIELEFLVCELGEEGEEGGDPGDNPVAVEGTEFEFSFEDGAFTTETTGIVFTNAGEQPHEVVVATVEGDTTVEEIIETVANEEEPEGVTDIAGTGAGPGGEGALAFEEPLEPGRYVMLCFVPDEETGDPHAALGMAAEFTVE
ncbi:MAG TPA: hypothetical protein VFO84_08845 [Dehalococcoidia bacterium]|nr:hypothetical protein [Dehalococcoidia bacterium]